MKNKYSATLFLVGTLLAPVFVYADTDADRSHPAAFVKDSVITAKIKTKLAAEHFSSLTRINVDTDNAGVVWLSGTATSMAEANKALSIAQATEGVVSVKSEISVKPAK